MSERFYSDARLYDRLFPGSEPAINFYRAEADRQGGSVLELGCGTGHKLIPIASDGHPCTGLELSSDMLTKAQRKADERPLAWSGCRATCVTSTWGAHSTSWSSQPIRCSICMRLPNW